MLTQCVRKAQLLASTVYALRIASPQDSRCFASSTHELEQRYKRLKIELQNVRHFDPNPRGVFCNSELDMTDISILGFDYDYTLASYTTALPKWIYENARDRLVNHFRYPEAIKNMPFEDNFVINGLHYDNETGFLFKLDAFQRVQRGTVYHGRQLVDSSVVEETYKGLHIPTPWMKTGRVKQFVDRFALPEMLLLSNVTEYFHENGLRIDPKNLFQDVTAAVAYLHISGRMGTTIIENLPTFLDKRPELVEVLSAWEKRGKQLFILSNSSYDFVDAGLKYIIGDEWRQLFEFVICRARKPEFFQSAENPFRQQNPDDNRVYWNTVDKFEKHGVYKHGNLGMLKRLAKWGPGGQNVLYFGDHVYSDLADAFRSHGWRTGAVIPEVANEIQIMNSAEFRRSVGWTLRLEELVTELQTTHDPAASTLLAAWHTERDGLRRFAKTLFNPFFGSMFRTYTAPTYFSARLASYSDIYTSSITNMGSIPSDYKFYPTRQFLPHESDLNRNIRV